MLGYQPTYGLQILCLDWLDRTEMWDDTHH